MVQSLLFMLRDNEDVFNVFCKKFPLYVNNALVDTIMNFMFNDIVSDQSDKRILRLMKEVIIEEIHYYEHNLDKILNGGVVDEIFEILT